MLKKLVLSSARLATSETLRKLSAKASSTAIHCPHAKDRWSHLYRHETAGDKAEWGYVF